MEDAHGTLPKFLTTVTAPDLRATKNEPLMWYGVFDGHGGDECAKVAAFAPSPIYLSIYLSI
jgi:serine/threonine protein phosphatase PrpC